MASRKPSVKHPSHNHPLRIYKALDEEEIVCSGCNLDLIGKAFKCTKSDCDYFLHKSCFELRLVIHHKAHPDHPLTLLYSTLYKSKIYGCNACGEYGSGFVYNCSICTYDLHIGCVDMPESMKREEHKHPLKLYYHSPKKCNFRCDVCEETVPNNLWSYHCKKCDYGTHLLDCTEEEDEEDEDEDDDEEDDEEEEPERGQRGITNNGENRGGGRGSELVATMVETQSEMEKMQIDFHLEMQTAKIAKKAREEYLKLI